VASYPIAHTAHPEEGAEHVSVPIILAVSLLCGIGIFGTAYWLYTYNWIWFPSLAPLIVGAYLLFTRLTGPDRA
jgi:hypothetical protein